MSSLCILALGLCIAVWQARTSVKKEVDSSINLASQLITFAFAQTPATTHLPLEWLTRFRDLKETRHLNIQLQDPNGQILHFKSQQSPLNHQGQPPQWFIHLVANDSRRMERPLISADGRQMTLLIQANPMDEVTEAWQESLGFFNTLLLLTGFTVLAVNLVFNQTLKATSTIVNALKSIETEDYQNKLPNFSIQEYNRIAQAINHLTEQLKTSQLENRALTQHSLAIQEDERQRLSQELHDECSQSLTAIKVMAVTCFHPKADIAKISQTMVEVCDHLIQVVRSMMRQLHPMILSELGLKAAIDDLVYHWSQRSPELQLVFTCPNDIDTLGQHLAIQLFRVVQEALTNIVRHAKATHAAITLTIEPTTNSVHLDVKDNGLGCDTQQIKHGFGLLGMRERVKSLGGEFDYESTPHQGLYIRVKIPLS